MNIFTNVNMIFHSKDFIKALFPEVFSGLGKLGKPYAIKLKPDTKLFCLRMQGQGRLPLELELKSMEEQGVIFCVKSQWISVVV